LHAAGIRCLHVFSRLPPTGFSDKFSPNVKMTPPVSPFARLDQACTRRPSPHERQRFPFLRPTFVKSSAAPSCPALSVIFGKPASPFWPAARRPPPQRCFVLLFSAPFSGVSFFSRRRKWVGFFPGTSPPAHVNFQPFAK